MFTFLFQAFQLLVGTAIVLEQRFFIRKIYYCYLVLFLPISFLSGWGSLNIFESLLLFWLLRHADNIWLTISITSLSCIIFNTIWTTDTLWCRITGYSPVLPALLTLVAWLIIASSSYIQHLAQFSKVFSSQERQNARFVCDFLGHGSYWIRVIDPEASSSLSSQDRADFQIVLSAAQNQLAVDRKELANLHPFTVKVTRVEKVLNPQLQHQFLRKKQELLKANHGDESSLHMRMAWHGTAEKSIKDICSFGFRNDRKRLDVGWFGNGSYFTSSMSYAAQYIQVCLSSTLFFIYECK